MHLRNFLLASSVAFALQAQAQTYTIQLSGTLSSCDSGSTVLVQDVISLFADSLSVGPGCSFSTSYSVGTPQGVLYIQAYCTNGGSVATTVDYDLGQSDTITLQVPLVCGPDVVDCQGVAGGPALNGTPCDDGDPATVFDTWDAACACAGFDSTTLVLDCMGIPFGPDMPGSPCIDQLNPILPFGMWSANCQCVPDSSQLGVDCLGVIGGSNHPGGYCDDGDASTAIDLWDTNCQCVGLDSAQVVFDCLGIPNGGNLPGTFCIDNNSPFLFGQWDASCTCVPDSSIFFQIDCLGITNGSALPGTSCDDGLVNTIADSWDPSCICTGFDTTSFAFDCLGVLNGTALPGTSCDDNIGATINDAWTVFCACTGTDTTLNVVDCLGIPNGPNLPGMPCTILPDSLNLLVGTWGPDCVCYSIVFDCEGVVGGSALPGLPCNGLNPDSTSFIGIWGPDCVCYTDSAAMNLDCAGVPNGTNLPGTPCFDLFDPLNPFLTGIWDLNCQCMPDSMAVYFDCLGIQNGPNLPFTACDDGDPLTTYDAWDFACTCVGYAPQPCQAGVEILPSAPDTTGGQPITLWIINTSFGGSGAFSYLWDFSDGATSTDMFPTHDYAGFGPYNLCLTVDDGNGCTDTYCDSLGLDSNGFFRNSFTGFTVSVMQGTMGTDDIVVNEQELNLWPNPARDELNFAFTAPVEGVVELNVMDLEGRVLRAERLSGGTGIRTLPLEGLANGIYLLRATAGSEQFTQRFVKAD